MKPYLFVSDDGAMYDTRKPDAFARPLREAYAKTLREIGTGLELRATIRAGQWAWPGGYEIFGIMSDGACLCMPCIKANYRLVLNSIRSKCDDGWHVVAFECAANTDNFTACDHCARVIVDMGNKVDENV